VLPFVHGFATAIFSPVASAYGASLAETGRGVRLGWFSSANDAGATAGPLIGGFVLHITASYPMTYFKIVGGRLPCARHQTGAYLVWPKNSHCK